MTTIVPTFKTFRGLDNFFYNHDAECGACSVLVRHRAHSAKFEYQGAYHIEDIEDHGNQNDIAYTFIFPAGFITRLRSTP